MLPKDAGFGTRADGASSSGSWVTACCYSPIPVVLRLVCTKLRKSSKRSRKLQQCWSFLRICWWASLFWKSKHNSSWSCCWSCNTFVAKSGCVLEWLSKTKCLVRSPDSTSHLASDRGYTRSNRTGKVSNGVSNGAIECKQQSGYSDIPLHCCGWDILLSKGYLLLFNNLAIRYLLG